MKELHRFFTWIKRHSLPIMIGVTAVLSVAVLVVLIQSGVLPRNSSEASISLDVTDPGGLISQSTSSSPAISIPLPDDTDSSIQSSTLFSETLTDPPPNSTSGTETKASATTTPTTKPSAQPTPTGPVWYDGFVDPRTVEYEIISNPGDITVLINKYYAVSEDYVPELESAVSSDNQKLRPEANAAWDLMRAACNDDTGKTLFLTAGYSTFPQRLALFEGAIKKVNDGVTGFTMKRVVSKYAYPGRSEHNVGLAIDIREKNDSAISSNFLNTVAGAWVAEHAHEYGYILRYPSGKGHITGYDFEAWHFRYVGVDLATTLHSSGQTLEEYYGKEQVLP